jgi:hypothetical protein
MRLEPRRNLVPVPLGDYGLRHHNGVRELVVDRGERGNYDPPPADPILEIRNWPPLGERVSEHEAYLFGVEQPPARLGFQQRSRGRRLPDPERPIEPDDHLLTVPDRALLVTRRPAAAATLEPGLWRGCCERPA